jgi:hypothetical protein
MNRNTGGTTAPQEDAGRYETGYVNIAGAS